MTTTETVLNVARGQLGVTATSAGDTLYSDWFGLPDESWCDMFVSWVAHTAGAADIIGKSAWCPGHVEWFKNRNQWGKTPRVGAVVFFDWNGDGEADHVGIVETVNADGSIGTIEGNSTNPAGGRYGVFRHTEWPRNILGYGYPAYDSLGNVSAGQPKLYTVKKGDTLFGIAAVLGISLSALLSANPGAASHPTNIQPGDKITVPGVVATSHAPGIHVTIPPTAPHGPVSKPVYPVGPAKPPVVAPPVVSPPAHVPSGTVRVLSYGDTGSDVSHLQKCLSERGYHQPVTGFYGSITLGNVHYFLSLRSWLWNKGSGPDDTAGPLTQAAICKF
jgi:LysM repeat protein